MYNSYYLYLLHSACYSNLNVINNYVTHFKDFIIVITSCKCLKLFHKNFFWMTRKTRSEDVCALVKPRLVTLASKESQEDKLA